MRGAEVRAVAVVALVSVAAALALWLVRPPLGPSALSSAPGGWRAARGYLDARGTATSLLDRRPSGRTRGVFVIAFPLGRALLPDDVAALRTHVRMGGELLVGYSGRGPSRAEGDLLDAFLFTSRERRGRAPIAPRRFLAWAREEVALRPPGRSGAAPVVLSSPDWVPEPPAQATPLLEAGDGEAFAFMASYGKGRVVVAPTQALANCRLGSPGNAAFLEALRHLLAAEWTFDEFHHGLVAADAVEARERAPLGRLGLLLAQIGAIYAAGVVALARRFGPPWREPVVAQASARAFLLGLGAAHHDLGHHREAALAMLKRARALEPRLETQGLDEIAERGDGEALVELARRLAEARTPGRSGT